ncbi:MAG: hypothetical protein AAF211_19180 [Myxococcota bacterium]
MMPTLLFASLTAFATPDAEYIDCDEFAGVGLVDFHIARALVPSDYDLAPAPPGKAIIVAQSGSCDTIRVNGAHGAPGIFAQVGIGVVDPLGVQVDGNFYQVAFATDHFQLARTIRRAGANARFTPFMDYTITHTGGVNADLNIFFPRPLGFAWEIAGPITLPDPYDTPNPLTTFNYWAQDFLGRNNLQRNDVSNIILGDGTQVQLTAFGPILQALVGGTTLPFPFFSAPEIFDSADVTIVRDAF